jgi:hypothetical protein
VVVILSNVKWEESSRALEREETAANTLWKTDFCGIRLGEVNAESHRFPVSQRCLCSIDPLGYMLIPSTIGVIRSRRSPERSLAHGESSPKLIPVNRAGLRERSDT